MALCLFKAAERGELDTVRQELSSETVNYCMCGAHENRYNTANCKEILTPLFAAAKNGQKVIVELLLAHKDIQVNNGSHIRVESGIDKVTLLYAAAKNGHEDIVELLLAQKDIQVNSASEIGIRFRFDESRFKSTPLFEASENGRKDIVELLLAHKDIQVNDGSVGYKDKKTPLFAAAENGHKDIVELLLAHEDININDFSTIKEEKITPLFAAAKNGHKDIVGLLLANENISVDAAGPEGITPLLAATEGGYSEIVALLLADKNISVNATGPGGITPLIAASRGGHKSIAKMLVSRDDTDFNAMYCGNWTPLSFAISRGDLDVMVLLLPKTSIGISCAITSKVKGGPRDYHDRIKQIEEIFAVQGIYTAEERRAIGYMDEIKKINAVEVAARRNKCYVIELLILKEDVKLNLKNMGHDNQSLDEKKKSFGIIKPFLSNGNLDWRSWGIYNQPVIASVMNIKDMDMMEKLLAKYRMNPLNQTLLSWAAKNGYKALIQFLLIKRRMDPNTKSDDGRTPLSWASENGHEDIVKLLLGKNIAEISNKEAEWDNKEENEHLLKNDADPNLEDDDGQTALSRALDNRHTAILKLLVPIDTITLFLLVKKGNRKAIKSLMAAGSKIDERNSQGQTPLHAAIISGQLEVAKDLISYGAGINLEDNDNMTPLRLAMVMKDGTLIQELLKNKAEMKDIMANEWRDAYGEESVNVVRLSEAVNGEMQVDFTKILPTANQLSHLPLDMGRYLYSIIEDPGSLVWSKVPVTHANERLKPNELYTSIFKATDDSTSDISLCMQLSIEHYLPDNNSIVSATNVYRIAWKMNRVTKPSSLWVSTVYFSTLPDGWIPQNDMGLFRQFMFHVKEGWLKLCQQFEKHLSSRRLKQLQLKGKSPDMIDFLANDAKKLAELRNILHNQIRSAERFIKDYCRYYTANKIPEGLLKDLANDFELIVNKWIGQLDQVVRDLLQIEFAWASINETRISTRLGQNVMLLTYVSIFYLPLGFCAALWAIPDITDPNTRSPFIITSIVIGLVTLLVTFNMERISKMVQRAIQSAKNRIQSNITYKKGQNGDQNKANEQSAGFKDNITTFVMRLARKEDQSKHVSQAEVSNV